MAWQRHDRLSAQDNDFLHWEKPNLPMHGGSTQIFEPGPLATGDGGVDFERITRGIEAVLHRIPRYRQKIRWLPGEQRAIWIDDAQFNLDYHMRHTALPRPGSQAQLKKLAARVMERPLDRSRPLWEIWVVEGLENGRFATIGKTHHCMVDGVGGMDLATSLMSTSPDVRPPESVPAYIPRSAPGRLELLRGEGERLFDLPGSVAREVGGWLRSSPDPAHEIATRVRSLGTMARWKLVQASETPLNGPIGPHRVLDWLSQPLAEIKAVRKARGCSVNDVVLAIVTGAVREFLIRRGLSPGELDFRIATPVSVRRDSEQGELGNRVSTWILRLPLAEAEPLRQLDEIHRTTQELKETEQAAAIELLEKVHEWIPFDLQSLSSGTQNMFVTNVPGPQFPLYLLGAELEEIFVQAPLIENLGVVIGVLSYNGKVCWGVNADYDRVPDVADFTRLLQESFEHLAAAAGVRTASAHPIEMRGSDADAEGSGGEA